jgi:hypothetical protein
MATKCTKWLQNVPIGRNIYQMAIIKLQDPPKFTQNGNFWFENILSGNPAFEDNFFPSQIFFFLRGSLQMHWSLH